LRVVGLGIVSGSTVDEKPVLSLFVRFRRDLAEEDGVRWELELVAFEFMSGMEVEGGDGT
jgi:hypothetical protein